jgi:hypothetical protein
MIQCPNCKNTLPNGFTRCQFCGTDVSNVPRPPDAEKVVRTSFQVANWVWIAYFGIAGYWLLGGAIDVFRGIQALPKAGDIAYVGIAFGGATALVAIGLIMRAELVRGLVNILSFLRILDGALGLWGALLGSLYLGPIAIVFAIFSGLDVASGLLMIYLIGETDKGAPNI